MLNEVIKIIAEIKEDPTLITKLDGRSHVIEAPMLDSLQLINLMLEVEERLGIEIDFDSFDFSNFESLETFAAYLSQLVRDRTPVAMLC